MNGITVRAIAIQGAIFIIASLLNCTHASASTITYNFDETGWVNTFGTTEKFFGSFTGTPDAQGNLALADLSSFSAEMTETNSTGATKTIADFGSANGTNGLDDFTYTAAANSLSLFATGTPGATICLGSAVTAGFCGALPKQKSTGAPAPGPYGLFFSSVNGQLDAKTLSTSVINPAQISPPTAMAPSSTTPEPAYLAAFGGILLLVARLIAQRRRATANRAGLGCPPGFVS